MLSVIAILPLTFYFYTCIYVCLYTYAYTDTHIHTYLHIHTFFQPLFSYITVLTLSKHQASLFILPISVTPHASLTLYNLFICSVSKTACLNQRWLRSLNGSVNWVVMQTERKNYLLKEGRQFTSVCRREILHWAGERKLGSERSKFRFSYNIISFTLCQAFSVSLYIFIYLFCSGINAFLIFMQNLYFFSPLYLFYFLSRYFLLFLFFNDKFS